MRNGTLHLCVFYRLLSGLTKKDSYPQPRMKECIDSFGDAAILSTLASKFGYWQVAIVPEDRKSRPSPVKRAPTSISGCHSA